MCNSFSVAPTYRRNTPVCGVSVTQNAFATAAGGGLDFNWTKHVSINPAEMRIRRLHRNLRKLRNGCGMTPSHGLIIYPLTDCLEARDCQLQQMDSEVNAVQRPGRALQGEHYRLKLTSSTA